MDPLLKAGDVASMPKSRFFWSDSLVFLGGRLFEALALAALVWAAALVTYATSTPELGRLDMFGVYLLVRAYFVTFGYLVLSALVFAGYALFGGLSSRVRVLFQSAGVLLIHGAAIGLLSPSVTAAYWLVGVAWVALSGTAAVFIWWPWLASKRGESASGSAG
jgi:hypothetical protein